jgi:antitoxin component YwqK of YwqJK toxin-antitoxin module
MVEISAFGQTTNQLDSLGNKKGMWKTFDSIRNEWSFSEYKNDTLNGKVAVYSKKKELLRDYTYKKGEKIISKEYYKSKKVYKIYIYSVNSTIVVTLHSNGKVYEEYELIDDNFHGYHRTYRKNGKLLYLKKYNYGNIIEELSYNKKGIIDLHIIYKNGVITNIDRQEIK